MKLPALIGNYDRQTDRAPKEVSLSITHYFDTGCPIILLTVLIELLVLTGLIMQLVLAEQLVLTVLKERLSLIVMTEQTDGSDQTARSDSSDRSATLVRELPL